MKLIDADKLREQIMGWDCSSLWHESFPVIKLIDEAPDLSVKEVADLTTETGHWLDRLDNKYCMQVESYNTSDIKETARHFYELGKKTRNSMPQITFYPEPQGEAIIDENGYYFKTVKSKELDEAAKEYANGPECDWVGTTALEIAFKEGANWQAQHSLTWEDIGEIYQIMLCMDCDTYPPASEAYYKEVLKRFNEQKNGL